MHESSLHNSLERALAKSKDSIVYEIRSNIDILENMGKMFFYFTAVWDFYGQYFDSLTANREIYLKQALFSSKLLRWFDIHIEELTKKYLRLPLTANDH